MGSPLIEAAMSQRRTERAMIGGDPGEPAAGESGVPRSIAHRGYAGVYPENTARAARLAGGHDETSMVEIDVVPTADGTVVCFHDPDLHETDESRGITDGTGRVWETPTGAVCSATVRKSGATVPRLAAVLAALPPGVGVNVELKHPGRPVSGFGAALSADERARQRDRWEPFVGDVLAILDAFDGEVLLSSFYEGALAACRSLAPSLSRGVLCGRSPAAGVTVGRRQAVSAIHPPVDAVLGSSADGLDVVGVAGDEGWNVNVWTVERWYQADRLARAGVDGLILDYPGLTQMARLCAGGE